MSECTGIHLTELIEIPTGYLPRDMPEVRAIECSVCGYGFASYWDGLRLHGMNSEHGGIAAAHTLAIGFLELEVYQARKSATVANALASEFSEERDAANRRVRELEEHRTLTEGVVERLTRERDEARRELVRVRSAKFEAVSAAARSPRPIPIDSIECAVPVDARILFEAEKGLTDLAAVLRDARTGGGQKC